MNLVLSKGQAMNFGSKGMSGNVLEYFTVQTRSRTDSLLRSSGLPVDLALSLEPEAPGAELGLTGRPTVGTGGILG